VLARTTCIVHPVLAIDFSIIGHVLLIAHHLLTFLEIVEQIFELDSSRAVPCSRPLLIAKVALSLSIAIDWSLQAQGQQDRDVKDQMLAARVSHIFRRCCTVFNSFTIPPSTSIIALAN
jgi:hypothetical protein